MSTSPTAFNDGDVVESLDGGLPYLIDGGRRHPILSPEAFHALDVDRDRVRAVAGEVVQAVPLADHAVEAPRNGLASFAPGPFATGKVSLGSGHYMETHGTIDMATGAVSALTHTWTITMLGGFHGACYLIYVDANDMPVSFKKVVHRYGVDGTWIGQSDRTDPWSENIGADAVKRLARIDVVFTWLPDSFQTVLNKWDMAAKTAGAFLADLGQVAKLIPLPAPPKP